MATIGIPAWSTYKHVRPNSYGYQQHTGYIGYKQELTDNLDIDYAFSYEHVRFFGIQTKSRQTNAYREDEYYGKVLLQWQPNDQHKIAFGTEISHRELGMKSLGWPDVVTAVSQTVGWNPYAAMVNQYVFAAGRMAVEYQRQVDNLPRRPSR